MQIAKILLHNVSVCFWPEVGFTLIYEVLRVWVAGMGSFTLQTAYLTTSWILLSRSLRGTASKTIPLILLFLEDNCPPLISTSFYIQAINFSLGTVLVWFWSFEDFHHGELESTIWQTLPKEGKSSSCYIYTIGLRPSSKPFWLYPEFLRVWNTYEVTLRGHSA